MFVAALFIIAKIGSNQDVGERVSKLWYIQTMDHYSVLERKELSSHEKTWRNLKFILLSERSQSEKVTYCKIPSIRHFGKGKTRDS